MKHWGKKKWREFRFQTVVEILLVIFLLLSFIPIFLTLFMSTKTNWEIFNDFFAPPRRIIWSNYTKAFTYLFRNMANTLGMIVVSVVAVLVLSVMGGFAFATRKFPGKGFLYFMILVLLMIPGCLYLAANYTLIKDYGLLNSRLAVILPWIAGGLVMGTILCRNSIEGVPSVLYEAARLEGCNDFHLLIDITIPLVKPILSTVAIMKVVDFYNDYIWPMMVIQSNDKQLVTVILKVFTGLNSSSGLGIVYAGYVIASLPLLILFTFTSRMYMEGLTAGAIKG